MTEQHNTTRWIVALCLTAVLAITGWTVTGTLASRLKSFEALKQDVASVGALTAANTIRISVLETKYDAITTSLAEIKVLLQSHLLK